MSLWNQKIKFAAVLDRALRRFALTTTPGWGTACCAAASSARTSPTCWRCSTYELRTRSPPSGHTTKDRVRIELLTAAGVADKPDSHDVVFIADGDTRGFLSRERVGAGRDRDPPRGRSRRRSMASYGFTVGQRRACTSTGRPRTAAPLRLSIEPASNTVTVGPPTGWSPRDHRDPPGVVGPQSPLSAPSTAASSSAPNQASGDEKFYRITTVVTIGAWPPVFLPELDLGLELLAGTEFAGVDLLPEVVGDYPVHRFSHYHPAVLPVSKACGALK